MRGRGAARGLLARAAGVVLLLLTAAPLMGTAVSPPLMVSGGETGRVFATGGTLYTHPTALASLGGLIYVGYANATLPDGSDGGSSTVAAYTSSGVLTQTYTITGSVSSLRAAVRKNLLYAVMNRLGNSVLVTISPTAHTVRHITLPATPPHGGGFGDVALVGDRLFASASNPTLNDAGANMAPALDRLSVNGTAVTATPVLMGNARAVDVSTGQTITLNEVDPTILAVTPAGDVMLVDQAGSELVFVHRPTSAKPAISSLLTGTQVVGVTWTQAGKGRLLVADTGSNTVYALEGSYAAGTPFAITAADSGVSALLATLNMTTGALKPFAIGFKDPAALLFTR